ncbi:MAG: site-specific DNA-methyltransferase, partial [Oscillospiraceae bacterium]|nr:site-specific DNA-methyltransferase [Oscillospiraceae bacterium]
MTIRKLYFGDNLEILRGSVKDNSVDLIYLDPPFNSQRVYNAYVGSDAQVKAFDDTWQWTPETVAVLDDIGRNHGHGMKGLLGSIGAVGGNDGLSAYLVMMAARLFELRRVLKNTGSVYLHCDPSAGHYLKVVMDSIFGVRNFRNCVIWKRTSAHSDTKGWGRIQDYILYYTMSDKYTWNKAYTGYSEGYLRKFFKHRENGRVFRVGDLMAAGTRAGDSGKPWRGIDPNERGNHWAIRRSFLNDPGVPENPLAALDYLDSIGRIYWPPKGKVPGLKRYLDETRGAPVQDIILDIPPLSRNAKEKLGFPTQKPLALLERIIGVSSNAGDVVLDPFCGCGTAMEAAEKLGRQWVGLVVSLLAIALSERRMREGFGRKAGFAFEVEGMPKDLGSARELAMGKPDGGYRFRCWACSLVGARPVG